MAYGQNVARCDPLTLITYDTNKSVEISVIPPS